MPPVPHFTPLPRPSSVVPSSNTGYGLACLGQNIRILLSIRIFFTNISTTIFAISRPHRTCHVFSHQDTYVQGWLSLPILSPSSGQLFNCVLSHDWVIFSLSPVLVCSSNGVLAFGHLSIRSPTSLPWVYLKIAAYTHPCRASNVPQRSSTTTQPTDVEPPAIMTIWGSVKRVMQDKPRHDCNTGDTSIRHHPLYLSFP